MVAIVQRYTNALASGLIPLLSRLSAGTEMASYGNAQWEFLLGSNEVTAFVAVEDVDKTTEQPELLGCLLRIDMKEAPKMALQNCKTVADNIDPLPSSAAGFGMMLVSPEARGRGLAKLLLHEAMSGEDERRRKSSESKKEKEVTPRKLLAVCTALGQPVYRKIGFCDVGRVVALKKTIGEAKSITNNALDVTVETYGSMDRVGSNEEDSTKIDSAILDLIATMDTKATGWDRRDRIGALLGNSREKSLRSIVAVASKGGKPVGAAALRQEGPGSPFVVGPMVGLESSALPLVSALAQAVNKKEDNSQLSLLVSDHPELVDRFVEAGFSKSFDFPAMAFDNRPIYKNGDGSYLGLIHPTLG